MNEDHTNEHMLACIKAVTGYEPAVPEHIRERWIAWMAELWTGYVNQGLDFGTAAELTIRDMRDALRNSIQSSS